MNLEIQDAAFELSSSALRMQHSRRVFQDGSDLLIAAILFFIIGCSDCKIQTDGKDRAEINKAVLFANDMHHCSHVGYRIHHCCSVNVCVRV